MILRLKEFQLREVGSLISVSGYVRINSNCLYEHIYSITRDSLQKSAVKRLYCYFLSSHRYLLFMTFERTMQTVVLEIMKKNLREMKLYQT